ncbi:MAG: thioredoxin family protein [Verrucomicrobia bacterium]|nr:thioredoxin family protein [Verrucomicrobiota bacterium]
MRKVTELQAKPLEREECWPTGPVLVHFRTSWCGQCRILAPSLETLAGELEGQLRIAEVNLDDCPEVAGRYGITQVPTLILFENGAPIECFDALSSPDELKVRLQGVLADYSAPVSGC